MSDKRKRSLSIKDLVKDSPPKKDKKCPPQDMVIDEAIGEPTLKELRTLIARNTTQLEELKVFIVRLHDMCLEVQREDSSEDDVRLKE